jgi:GNAT superfamily N-acetyltransferase
LSFLDNMLASYGRGAVTTPRVAASDPFDGGGVRNADVGGFTLPTSGVGSSREAGPPARFNVSPDAYTFKIGEADATGAVGAGAAAAQAPGYLRERPVAALDTLIGGATGVQPIGELEKFVEGIPVLGPVLGGLANFVNGRAFAGLVNSQYAGIAGRYNDRPDSMLLQLGPNRSILGEAPAGFTGQTMPLGELRKELYGRGFMPEDFAAVAAGTKSQFDFGDRAISANPWANLGISLGADPTNLLLMTPLGGVKASALAARVGLTASKMKTVATSSSIFERALGTGLAKTALDAKQAAAAIARGVPGTEATLAGMGQFFRVVARGGKTYFGIKGQVGVTLGTFAVGEAAEFMADHTDKGTPIGGFFENLRDVADRIENNKPLSQNAMFSMYSAMNFPLRGYAREGWSRAVGGKNIVFGTGELDRFAKQIGVKKNDMVAWAGSKESVASFVDFIDEKIALQRLGTHPLSTAYLGSMQEAAVRFAKTRDLTAAIVADMRAKGEISMADRAQAAKDWYTASGEGANYRGVHQQWDPALAFKQWGQEYQPLAQHLQPMLAQHGVALGLNDATSAINSAISKESISSFLAMARRKAVNGHIAPRDVQALLDVVPLHKVGTKTAYWDRIFIRDAKPVSLRSLESKLGKLRAESPGLDELLAGFTRRETDAAKAVPGHFNPEQGAAALNNTLEGSSITASRMTPALAVEQGLNGPATSLFEARVARAHPTVSHAESAVPKALAQAGFPVQIAKRVVVGADGGLQPSFVSVLAPSPIADVRLAAAMTGHALDQGSVLIRVAPEHLATAGVKANSRALRFENLPSAHASEIHAAAQRAFPDKFTYDQVAGTLEVIVPTAEAKAALAVARKLEADLKAAIPQSAVGGVEAALGSQVKVYAEWLERGQYGTVIDDAVRAGDPRVYAFDALSADFAGASERAANLALSEGSRSLGGGLGLGGSRLPRSPRDWGDVVPGEIAQPGRSASAAEELRQAVDNRGFGGDAAYVSYARQLDADVADVFPMPRERVRPTDGPEFFDLTPEEYNQPLVEAPTEVAPAASLVRTEAQAAPDLAADIQRAYDAGDIEKGQALQRQIGGTAESGGAVRSTDMVPDEYAPGPGPLRHYGKGKPGIVEEAVKSDSIRRFVYRNEAGKPVAYAELSIADGAYKLGPAGQPASVGVYVDPAFRRQGIATRLYDAVQAEGLDIRSVSGQAVTASGRGFTEAYWRSRPATPATAADRAIAEAAQAGEELGVRPGVETSIADTPPEYLVRRDADTGEWVPLLKHDVALAEARAAGRAPLSGAHPSLREFDPATLQRINELEAWVRTNYPRYRLEKAPEIATGVKPKSAQQVALGEYNTLGNWLFNGGRGNIFSPVFNFLNWAATPKPNQVFHEAARQALFSELISRGAKAKEVDRFLKLARGEAENVTFGTKKVHAFRDWSSLPANRINQLAVEAGLPASVTEAMGPGRFHLLVDRASSRYYRNIRESVISGGKRGQISRGLQTVYDTFQTGTGVRYLYDAERATAKVFYHLFRFVSDPRWWAMNLLEADVLNAARHGIGSTRFAGGEASRLGDQAAFIHGQGRLPTATELSRTTKKGKTSGQVPPGQRYFQDENAPGHYSGWNDTRNLSTYIIKAFDRERAASTGEALRAIGDNHPVVRALRDRFGESTDDWMRGVDETMYRFDTLGVKGTIDEAARELEAQGLMSIPEMRPFIEQLYNQNQRAYDAIVGNLHGNGSRTNIERMLNSYWLYWPISYQLKAGKWLFDVMTHKFAGRETNLGGLYAYENLRRLHMETMARDEEYAATFDGNPELWFAAQMLVPITPDDMGVSLSRPIRYAASWARDVTGGDEGPLSFLHHYRAAEDPVQAAAQVMNFGPIYTWQQFQAVLGDLQDNEPTEATQPHL